MSRSYTSSPWRVEGLLYFTFTLKYPVLSQYMGFSSDLVGTQATEHKKHISVTTLPLFS
jgi:hypothetical protein